MEVFAKYFRRLLVGNSPQIFPGINRNVENVGNYPLLVEEIEKASKEWEAARKIAEVIDTSEGDIFREFDLAAFLSHFKLDPISTTILAAAFTHVSKLDLRNKGTNNTSACAQHRAVLLTPTSVFYLVIYVPATSAHSCQPEQHRTRNASFYFGNSRSCCFV